ncbi:sulfoxide reductase heme-binding subunit YedZ [Chitinimonas sp. DQS-5]|uniref:Protein-methionine-sulfoxide reductase heme-binding subunit MsrQ n=2 Tax=Parachitinimonas caeni TaxID=3031301 RepID=A0ABT7DR09_9NEIS|nr:sulfoxide reductase heme-binding subunit YedZ [Parachitinimonas caeni]
MLAQLPLKPLVFILCLLPLARTLSILLRGQPVNPIEFLTRSTGTWTLVLLLITLSLTPLRRLTGTVWPLRLRRMMGLFAFFYASLHFTTYLWLDQFFDLAAILRDIRKRPFITVGFMAFVLLLPLAATSTDRMLRRLKRNWQRLHYAVYPIAILAIVHYWWLVKRDLTQPMVYGSILAVLLGIRLWWKWQTWRRSVARAQPAIQTDGRKIGV